MKRIPSLPRSLGLTLILAVGATFSTAKAQTIVFTEDWETDHSSDGTYVTNVTTGSTNLANLYFDYSTAGVPLSPNSPNSSTRALKLCANLQGTIFGGVSVSPVGFGIADNFDMRFDCWWNFNGPFTGGGSGSTQIGGAGYGTAGTNAQTAGVADSIFIGGSTDGNTASDFRVYSSAHAISYQGGSYQIGSSGVDASILGDPNTGFVYAGTSGSRDSDNIYFQTNFPAVQCPTNQFLLFPQQTNSNGTLPGLPGFPKAGTLAFKWRDVSLKKVGNIITYSIDGVLCATVDVTDAGPLGGTNILFNMYDINTGSSTDPNRTNLIFTLIDNVRITSYTNVVTVTNTIKEAAEAGPTAGQFTITRTASGPPLTINYKMSGTASNGVDYTNILGGALSGSVTFGAGETSTNITIVPIDDGISEPTETVVLSITPALEYVGAGNATVTIADNDGTELSITNLHTQMYERTNDYATFRVTRLGDTNVASFNVNFSFSGSATEGVDYYTNAIVTFDAGVVTADLTNYPIADLSVEGNETITCSIAAAGGGEYTIGSPSSASITLVDANLPAEAVLFQDNFDVDSSASWNLYFAASTNNLTPDYNAVFAFDYGAQGIPPAPHGGGNGLFLNVNKDADASAAALNLYPIGQNFSGNFALRFDMFLSVPQPSTVATEYVLAGINHSGTKTNWWRSGGVPVGSTFDGVFFTLETDNQSSPNYANYSSPTTAGLNPTLLGSQTASNNAASFKSPPWVDANTPGNVNNPAGVFATPIWADVEISKSGNLITLIINNTKIYTYSNATAFASGNIMVGYDDAFDSISPGQSYAVLDNVRVVAITPPVITAQPVNSTNAVGTPATFTVTATTSTTVTNYQWFLNNVAIANATNASYSVASVATANYGSYRVEVSDGRYTTVSSTVVLSPPVPVINIQPSSRAAVVGSSPTFSVTATSFSGVTNYQWFYYGTNVTGAGISGATTRLLTLANVQAVNFNGPYTVRVNDGTTSITSAPSATITAAVSPTVAAPAAIGANFVFSYPSEVGPNYVVDFKSALTNVAWTPIKTNSGTGGTINITNALSGGQGYFRIRLQ